MAQDSILTEKEFRQLQKGDALAFQKVYDAYFSLIQYVIHRCGVDHEEKRDLIQETFLRLHIKAKEIRDAAAVKAWLVTCARNLAIDSQRRKKMLSIEDTQVQPHLELMPDDTQADLERELEIKLIGKLIHEVCEQEQDDTLRLFYIDGLKAREIAAQRGEAVSTVTMRLSRLRLKFQQIFLRHLDLLCEGGAHGNARQ